MTEEMHSKYQSLVLSTVRPICRCEHIAQDLAQEVWIKVHKSTYDGRDPKPWLRMIAKNVARDWLRHRARRPCVSFDDLEVSYDTPGKDVQPLDRLCRDEVWDLELPRHLRLVVELRYRDGLSTRDIAERLGIPEGTVRSRLHTAHKKSRAA